MAIQQGAGFAVKKSDKATEAAAVEFLKYLSTGGLDLSVSLSYMPVTKADYKAGNAEKMQTAVIEDAWTQYLKKEEKTEADFTAEKAQEIKDGYRVSKKGILDTYEVAYKTIKEYELWASIPFAQSSDARKLLRVCPRGTISAKDEPELAEMVKNSEKRHRARRAGRGAGRRRRAPLGSGGGRAFQVRLRRLVRRIDFYSFQSA